MMVTGVSIEISPMLMAERHQRHGIGQRLSRRLTLQLGFSSIREVENLSVANKHRLFTRFQKNRPRKHYREKVAKLRYIQVKKITVR